MSVACTIGMAELQHDGKCKNDYESGAIVFTGGTGLSRAPTFDLLESTIHAPTPIDSNDFPPENRIALENTANLC
jgi:hypothetical protein